MYGVNQPTYPYQQPYMSYQRPIMQQPIMQPTQPDMIVRAVTSREEAVATPIDYAGRLTVMIDQSHGMVYTKGLNNMAEAEFVEYARTAAPKPPQPPAYAMQADLDALIKRVDAMQNVKEASANE